MAAILPSNGVRLGRDVAVTRHGGALAPPSEDDTRSSGLRLPGVQWLKAPFGLLRFPGLVFAIAASVAVLALAVSSAPLFTSSAASAALDSELERLPAREAGLAVEFIGGPREEGVVVATDDRLLDAAGGVANLGEPLHTIRLSDASVRDADDGELARVRPLARSDALDHVEVVEAVDGASGGVWLPASAADAAGLGAGEVARLGYGDARAQVPVAGVYEDLRLARPLPAYWQPLASLILDRDTDMGPQPQPQFLLADRSTIVALGLELGDNGRYRWQFPLEADGLTLTDANATASGMRWLESEARDPFEGLGEQIAELHAYQPSQIAIRSSLPGAVGRVDQTVAALSGPVGVLWMAGAAVAAVVIAAAALFAVARRRIEVRLHAALGVSAVAQGARGGLEAVLPAVLGAVVGWAGAVGLVAAFGPSPLVEEGASGAALQRAGWSAVAAILVVAVVTAIAARREAAAGSSRVRRLAARARWEPVVLALAGAAFYQIQTRESVLAVAGDGAAQVDLFVLLFPLLFIAGLAGLACRALGMSLPRLRNRADGARPAMYLAVRRLAGAPTMALLLVTAAAFSAGILVYSGVLVTSTGATVDAKAAVIAGSDVATRVRSGDEVPELPAAATSEVTRIHAELVPGGREVDVLAIDTATFADTALPEAAVGDRPLDELVAALTADHGQRVPVATAGVTAGEGQLAIPGFDVPVTSVATMESLPGMRTGRPLVLVDREALLRIADDAGLVVPRVTQVNEVWARGDPAPIVEALSSVGIDQSAVTTASGVRTGPGLAALSWSFDYLQALGIAAGALTLVGMLLYLQARQAQREVSYAMARRMGLARASHRRTVAVELAGMLGAALLIGGSLALLAARLVLGRLDPLPAVPPAPLFAIPVTLLVAASVAVLVAAAVGAWWVQRAADRAKVSEVLRLAD